MGKRPGFRENIYHATKPELHATSNEELSKINENEEKFSKKAIASGMLDLSI